jgi:threonine synthase
VNFCSTRDEQLRSPLSRALQDGIAPDGGLFVPVHMPKLNPGSLPRHPTLAEATPSLLAPYFAGDPLASELPAIATEAFDFPVPLRPVRSGVERVSILELFHGPTAAFKDFGARFLAACLARIPRRDSRPITILVATSGDTGSAVAAAFHRRRGFRVALLFPAGRVSPLQERQLTCWGDNVRSYAIRGSFDDCQRLVKQSFQDERLREALALTSANSINVGRLLPQLTYFAEVSLGIRESGGGNTSFVIPSGNLGHAVACIWAREMGMPIGQILLAHNANRVVPDFLASGQWRPRESIATVASAMDVGNPSNMERLRLLYRDHEEMTARVRATSVSDEEIRASIKNEYQETGLILCPHTAAAAHAYRGLDAADKRSSHWVIVATAHPAKFPEIIEPLIGTAGEVPPALARLMVRDAACEEIDPDFDGLRERLLAE